MTKINSYRVDYIVYSSVDRFPPVPAATTVCAGSEAEARRKLRRLFCDPVKVLKVQLIEHEPELIPDA